MVRVRRNFGIFFFDYSVLENGDRERKKKRAERLQRFVVGRTRVGWSGRKECRQEHREKQKKRHSSGETGLTLVSWTFLWTPQGWQDVGLGPQVSRRTLGDTRSEGVETSFYSTRRAPLKLRGMCEKGGKKGGIFFFETASRGIRGCMELYKGTDPMKNH